MICCVEDVVEVATLDVTDFTQDENGIVLHQLMPTAEDGSQFNDYKFESGDIAAFNFNEATGEFSLKQGQDFENPTDLNGDSIYSFTLTATSETGYSVTSEIDLLVEDVVEVATLDVTDFTQDENGIVLHQLTPTAEDGSEFNDYKFESGDIAAFNFNETTGEFSLKQGQDFENPTDLNGDSIYSFTVTATSETGYSVTSEIDLLVEDVVEVATLDVTDFTQNENGIVLHQLSPTAEDGSQFNDYKFESGDIASFNFNEATGEFSLKQGQDFENPTDLNGDSIYSFTVTATSVTGYSVTSEIDLLVEDVVEVATLDVTDFTQDENGIVLHQLIADGRRR